MDRVHENEPCPSSWREIPLGEGKVAIVDAEDYERLSQLKWRINGAGYACRMHRVAPGKAGRVAWFMHRVVAKTPAGMHTDHVNGDKLDNRKANLRVCTHVENCRNKRGKRTPKLYSQYKGVSRDKRDGAWTACIKIHYKNHNIGRFKTEEEAAVAYNMAALREFREFARLNYIPAIPHDQIVEYHGDPKLAQW